MADRFQISMMTPSKGRDYVTISISIFMKCGKCQVFANLVIYVPVLGPTGSQEIEFMTVYV